MTSSIGLDFGTTNSSLALFTADNSVRLAKFPIQGGETESYRSIEYFENFRQGTRNVLKAWTGPSAIEHYLDADQKGRLIQSLKSFLTSRSLVRTDIFGRSHTLEDLVAFILRDIKNAAEQQFGTAITTAAVGRPVRFAGSNGESDDEFAVSRLRLALENAGFDDVAFELEPVAAAFYYESTLDHDELILIGDFGGGTSDFSLLRVGPSSSKLDRKARKILGNEGLGLAGDAFDARIVKHVISPALGADSSIRSMGKTLKVPQWIYTNLERWHHLSLLKSRDTLNLLRTIRSQALCPEMIDALFCLVNNDLGYELHQAVQRAKMALSTNDAAGFVFEHGDLEIRRTITRNEFESWIHEDIQAIESAVDRLLQSATLDPTDVDMVFLTGGSSFVPAVRRVFETRFGERISCGNEFTSVARGLALSARARKQLRKARKTSAQTRTPERVRRNNLSS